MNALAELIASLLEPYVSSPLWASVIGTLMVTVAALLASVAMYRFIQGLAKRLSPGPVFMFGALLVSLGYLVVLIYFTANDRSFEQGVLEWLMEVTELPLDALGIYHRPMLLAVFAVVLGLPYLLVVLGTAWAVGLFSKDGDDESVAAEIEGELGTSLVARFYRLCGYHRPDAVEKRFHGYGIKLTKILGYAKWLSLPALFTGAIPVALWVVGSILHDGLKRNLTAPPAAPEEEERGQ